MDKTVAKIFRNGTNQAVRIPVEFSFDVDEVFISRNERGEVVLTPRMKTWADFFALPLPEAELEIQRGPNRENELFADWEE